MASSLLECLQPICIKSVVRGQSSLATFTAKSRITGTIELADLTYADPEDNRVLSDC